MGYPTIAYTNDVTFDESVPFYCLFPYRSAPLPPPPLFLAPHPPPVDPLPPQGPAPSGTARGVASGGAASGGATSWGAELARAEPGGAEPEGAGSGGAEPGGVVPWGAEPASAEPGGAEPEGAEPGGAESEGAESGGAEPRGTASSGATGAGGSAAGGSGAGGVGTTRLGGAGLPAGAGGTGAAGIGGVGGSRAGAAGAGDPGAGGAGVGGAGAGGAGTGGARAGDLGAGGAGAGGTGAGGAGAGGTGAGGAGAGGAGAGDTGAVDPGARGASVGGAVSGGTERREPESHPASPVRAVCTGRRVPRPHPPPVPGTHVMALHPSFVPLRVPLPPPPESSLPTIPNPESDLARTASPTVSHLLATVATDPSFESIVASALVAELVDFAAACRLHYATSLVAESESDCPPSIGGECALSTDVLEDRHEDFECLAAAVPHLVAMLTAMDVEMASWKSTCPYVDAVPPSGANKFDGILIFRVKRPPGSPPVFKARYIARGFSQRQGVDFFQTFSPTPKMTTLWVLLHVTAQCDYKLHSLDFSTAFLQGSLHEEIWLRRQPSFTGSFPAGNQTTLAALGFAPLTADLSLFLRTDTSLPPLYVPVYVNDLVFATAVNEALALVKSELQKRHTCTDLGELRSYLGLQITRDRARRTITQTQSHMVHQVLQRFGFRYSSPQSTPLPTGHSLSAPPSNESVEPSGPYPDLVDCLMVLRYFCSTSGMGLVLGGRGPFVLTSHADASWELHWLTYLLINLGEQPRSPPVLYVDNKAMIALCQEDRLEHRTKLIALLHFLARELQQRLSR
ncbi:unnamed protein product [Closterium sp. NIES-54]